MFRMTPYIVFGAMALAAAIVPSLATDLPFARAADAIALVGLPRWRGFQGLAAMDIGTASGSMGARREMFVGFLAEPALLMVLFTASLISGLTSLPTIVDTLATQDRDLPEPRFCRRRVHDGVAGRERAHPDRQSGHTPGADDDPRGDDPRIFGATLALIEWASALKLFNYSCIGLALFIPFGIAEGGELAGDPRRYAGAGRQAAAGRLRAGGDRDAVGEDAHFRAPSFWARRSCSRCSAMLVTLMLAARRRQRRRFPSGHSSSTCSRAVCCCSPSRCLRSDECSR